MSGSRQSALPATIWRHPLHWCALGFGIGAVPFAPGTFGTLLAVPVYFFMQPLALSWYLAVVAALFIFGIVCCHVTAQHLKVHDHPAIVWDEIVGYLVTMTAAPRGWWWMVIGFVLFRFFDIVKPWPVRQVDRRLGGGIGIMLDDVAAALYSALVLQALAIMWPQTLPAMG